MGGVLVGGFESSSSDLKVQIRFRTIRLLLLILFLTQLVAISPAQSSTWSTLGAGLNGTVDVIEFGSASDVYVAGGFTEAGGQAASRIAKWNGAAWETLTTGVDGAVFAMKFQGTDLFVGGAFTTAGGVTVNGIAKWNTLTSAWESLTTGVSGGASPRVFALEMIGSDLFVGGDFITAGGVTVNDIAKWDGSSWSPLGDGVDDPVRTLSKNSGVLYVGGYFGNAGGLSAKRIATYNPSNATWSHLNSNFSGHVASISFLGSDVIAAGSNLGTGVHIYKYSGSSWSELGAGTNNYVFTTAVVNSEIYVGGSFTSAGGVAVNRIAKWDGSSWSAVGTGANNAVRSIKQSTTDLYFVGYFTEMNSIVANRIAILDVLRAPPQPLISEILPGDGQLRVTSYFESAANDAFSVIQYSLNGGSTFETATSFIQYLNNFTIDISSLTNGIQQTIITRATNRIASGSWSAAVTGTPGVPDQASISQITEGVQSLIVRFGIVPERASQQNSYEISINNGSSWTLIDSAALTYNFISSSYVYTVSGLTADVSYLVRVRARNTYGPGAQSSAVAGTPGAPPPPSGSTSSSPVPQPYLTLISNAMLSVDVETLTCKLGRYKYGLVESQVEVKTTDNYFELLVEKQVIAAQASSSESASWKLRDLKGRGLIICETRVSLGGFTIKDSTLINNSGWSKASDDLDAAKSRNESEYQSKLSSISQQYSNTLTNLRTEWLASRDRQKLNYAQQSATIRDMLNVNALSAKEGRGLRERLRSLIKEHSQALRNLTIAYRSSLESAAAELPKLRAEALQWKEKADFEAQEQFESGVAKSGAGYFLK